jgi:ribosomal protein S18 acetylase RimI-like enzyme
VQRDFPAPSGDPAGWSRTQRIYHDYHHPDVYCPEPYADYPSHLHIDLLPRAQGHGWGRRMMEHLLGKLRSEGSPGVHLGVGQVNERAVGFYGKLGFAELARVRDVLYLGRRLI